MAMLIRCFILFCAVTLASGISAAVDNQASRKDSSPVELGASILHASNNPESPFQLKVNCTDDKGIRSFNLFPGGVTIWNGRSQLSLPPATRSAMLRTILEQKFPDMKPSYGGRARPKKEAAAPRISCGIFIKIDDLQKTSVQKAGGEQSAQLTGLAAALIDQVEPFAENGITANDLNDALDKLLEGELAPETLTLRFMNLPARDYISQGFIVRIRGGRLSRQAYTPGSAIGEPSWHALGENKFMELVTALRKADPGSLPGNLWSENRLELEIHVLAHKKILLAGPFSRLEPESQEPEQQRFETLLESVWKL